MHHNELNYYSTPQYQHIPTCPHTSPCPRHKHKWHSDMWFRLHIYYCIYRNARQMCKHYSNHHYKALIQAQYMRQRNLHMLNHYKPVRLMYNHGIFHPHRHNSRYLFLLKYIVSYQPYHHFLDRHWHIQNHTQSDSVYPNNSLHEYVPVLWNRSCYCSNYNDLWM